MTSTEIVPVRGSQEIIPATPSGLPDYSQLSDSPRGGLFFGTIVAALFFVGALGWAAFARLDAAAFGTGQVTVAGNRQTVQHRDGGNVAALPVREGQRVRAGDILIRLAGSEVEATERALAASVIDLQAQRARLEADIRGTPIAWPASFATATGDDRIVVDRAIKLQLAQRAARQALLASNRGVLAQQGAEASQETSGLVAQAEASAIQRKSLEEQLANTRKLADEGYVSRNSVRALERTIADIDGSRASFAARAAAAREQVGASRQLMTQAGRKDVDDAATVLRDTQFQLNDSLPKWIAAKDRLERTVIRAPVAGRVVGLKVFSVGGVVQAGQPILDIVPDNAPLVLKAQFAPTDIDGVVEGSEAEVKFLSIHERKLPILLGMVRNVSADALRDEASGASYFTAEIVVPKSQLDLLKQIRGNDTGVRPGVPVQVTIKLRKRTALEYFLEPLISSFWRSLRER